MSSLPDSTEPTFTIGYNTPGYMPEMEPYAVSGADVARDAMRHEIERHCDSLSMGPESEGDALYALLRAALDTLGEEDISLGWDAYVTDPEREHDLGTHYWITPGGEIEGRCQSVACEYEGALNEAGLCPACDGSGDTGLA